MAFLGVTVAFQSRQLRVMTNSRSSKKIQLTKHNLVVGQGIIAGYVSIPLSLTQLLTLLLT